MTLITETTVWSRLQACAQLPCVKTLFATDSGRFGRFSVAMPGLLADFSKNPVTDEVKSLLLSLAVEARVAEARDAFFAGEKINITEDRPAMHMALRAPASAVVRIGDQNVMPEVHETLRKMGDFTDAVRSGSWRGHGGRRITDIVNIGIGGSTLGPQLATEALLRYHPQGLSCHYVANADASDMARVLNRLSPETTLFIIASKTFTTAETMQNARIAKAWILDNFKGNPAAVAAHFVAASVNSAAVAGFGIAAQNMFPFQDWVGGRYSVWSSIGLSTMIMIGPQRFSEFLAGAHEIDNHFKTAPFAENIPVLMALIGVWHRNFLGYSGQAVLPYHALLRRMPAYLQQLEMESNGKAVTSDGSAAPMKTGVLVFGEPGTDAQHIFMQWLHQGSDIVPVDFIAAVKTSFETEEQQNMLLANLLAQGEALMTGRTDTAEPWRAYPGNRPVTTILFDALDARALGMLLALYEHKVFVQGVLWGINSFDQFGVELGKTLASALANELAAGMVGKHDGSTQKLLAFIFRSRESGAKTANRAA